MAVSANDVKKALRSKSDPKRAKVSIWFFKTGKGQYGEGDKFLGVDNGTMRKIAKQFSALTLPENKKLLQSVYHEDRQAALFILVNQFERNGQIERKKIFDFYIKNVNRINNWDLVDCSAYKIVGFYLFNNNFPASALLLKKMAVSANLWERRIAIISTFYFIRENKPELTLEIAEILLNDKEDLMHKAVGWMLREVGKRLGAEYEEIFLKKYYKKMPRTMLRYAIERFPEQKRLAYLRGKI